MKCKKCGKHKSSLKDLETNERMCLWCGIKISYGRLGIKGIYKLLKMHFKTKWHLSWKGIILDIMDWILSISLTLISILSFVYVLINKQYLLIPNSLISLLVIWLLWRD